MTEPVAIIGAEESFASFAEIVNACKVVAYWNPPMANLVEQLERRYTHALVIRPEVDVAVRAGSGVFEALEKLEPKFAEAIHDFVYLIVHPFSSITIRDITRERVAKLILEL